MRLQENCIVTFLLPVVSSIGSEETGRATLAFLGLGLAFLALGLGPAFPGLVKLD